MEEEKIPQLTLTPNLGEQALTQKIWKAAQPDGTHVQHVDQRHDYAA